MLKDNRHNLTGHRLHFTGLKKKDINVVQLKILRRLPREADDMKRHILKKFNNLLKCSFPLKSEISISGIAIASVKITSFYTKHQNDINVQKEKLKKKQSFGTV